MNRATDDRLTAIRLGSAPAIEIDVVEQLNHSSFILGQSNLTMLFGDSTDPLTHTRHDETATESLREYYADIRAGAEHTKSTS